MKKPRKRAWYAGLTLAQRAIANEIIDQHIRRWLGPTPAEIARALPADFKMSRQ